MKMEIDLSDRSQLVKTKAELNRYLSIIEFALMHGNSGNRNGGNAELPLNGHSSNGGSDVNELDKPVLEIIQRLPNKFTTSDVIVASGEEGKTKRPSIKLSLSRAVHAGTIRVATKGSGRRPNTYEKVSA